MGETMVPRFLGAPSADHFSQLESCNSPAVFDGLASSWLAFTKWSPSNGGLEYLKSIAGSASVQAMVTRSGCNFYGDIRGHERICLPFGEFLDLAISIHGKMEIAETSPSYQSEEGKELYSQHGGSGQGTSSDIDENHNAFLPTGCWMYLAQVSVFQKEQQEPCPLEALMQDISLPEFLKNKDVTNINLWMNASESRSSNHYDPYHNILSVIAGCKKVRLWPPSETPLLYPFPIHGEASNHSSVDFVQPDVHKFPLFEDAMKSSHMAVLNAGDSIFIPEGWYHQIDSERLTIGINIWWSSSISLAFGTRMDGYYLRRIVASLLEQEKERILQRMTSLSSKEATLAALEKTNEHEMLDLRVSSPNSLHDYNSACVVESSPSGERDQDVLNLDKVTCIEKSRTVEGRSKNELRMAAVCQLTNFEKECLKHLVLNCPSSSESQVGNSPTIQGSEDDQLHNCFDSSQSHDHPGELKQEFEHCSDHEEVGDIIARIFLILEPMVLQKLLLLMVGHFPCTLASLILHRLSPLAAEALTRKFDEMDKLASEYEQAEFYKSFYSVFEDPQMAMAALLDGKEVLSARVLISTMERFLSLSCRLLD